MESLLIGNEKRKKRLLLEELERYGIIFKAEEALEVPEEALERQLQEVKSKQYTSNRPRNWVVDLYESIMLDYVEKLAGQLLFSHPILGLLLFWAPFYYYYNSKRGTSK